MIAETSLLVYHTRVLPKLSESQLKVFDKMRERDDWTNQELADALGWGINRLTPRVKELRDAGVVKESFESPRMCHSTGNMAKAWNVGLRGSYQPELF
jgi:hypothetical protein